MASAIQPGGKALQVGRIILFVLLFGLVGLVLYRYYVSSGGLGLSGPVPQELEVNYVPADYNFEVNEEDALAILENPYRYRREFDQMVQELNLSILDHVTTRMGMPDSLKTGVRQEYQRQHPYLSDLYFRDYVALKDTSSTLYQSWYDNESTNSVEQLNKVASKYTCFLVTNIITALVKTREGSVFARGKSIDTPCGIATTEALQPWMEEMKERASIMDFSRSQGLLQERVEKVIAELATMEVRDKKGISKQLQTRIWGFSVSTTDLQISAISILKVGYRLNEYLSVQLDEQRGEVTVTLPEPVILSHEVYPKFDKLDIGWMRELEEVDINKSLNVLREEFRRDARENDVYEKSKAQAVELMNTLFEPLVNSIDPAYRIKVRFQQSSTPAELPGERTDTLMLN
ncbi:MAG: DUF4230 domain-containing protein [Saprospiraceae bacterium]|nr:DUF4230 domain-containing protein [Saprospiraceae bacterium]